MPSIRSIGACIIILELWDLKHFVIQCLWLHGCRARWQRLNEVFFAHLLDNTGTRNLRSCRLSVLCQHLKRTTYSTSAGRNDMLFAWREVAKLLLVSSWCLLPTRPQHTSTSRGGNAPANCFAMMLQTDKLIRSPPKLKRTWLGGLSLDVKWTEYLSQNCHIGVAKLLKKNACLSDDILWLRQRFPVTNSTT